MDRLQASMGDCRAICELYNEREGLNMWKESQLRSLQTGEGKGKGEGGRRASGRGEEPETSVYHLFSALACLAALEVSLA